MPAQQNPIERRLTAIETTLGQLMAEVEALATTRLEAQRFSDDILRAVGEASALTGVVI